RSGLPTVIDDILDSLLTHFVRADCLFVAVEVLLEVILHKPAVQLVHLEPCGLWSSRMIGDAQQRIAYAQNYPLTLRRSPVQCSVGMHLGREINHIRLPDHG